MILSLGLMSKSGDAFFRRQRSVLESEPAGKRFTGDDTKLRKAGPGTGSAPACHSLPTAHMAGVKGWLSH